MRKKLKEASISGKEGNRMRKEASLYHPFHCWARKEACFP